MQVCALSISFRVELEALWLITAQIVTSSPGTTAIFCHYVFTSFQSFIPDPAFCESREASETEAFL